MSNDNKTVDGFIRCNGVSNVCCVLRDHGSGSLQWLKGGHPNTTGSIAHMRVSY